MEVLMDGCRRDIEGLSDVEIAHRAASAKTRGQRNKLRERALTVDCLNFEAGFLKA
jgi:hypothetical protein